MLYVPSNTAVSTAHKDHIAAIDNYSHEGSIISLLTPRVGALGLNLATAGIVVMIVTGCGPSSSVTYQFIAEGSIGDPPNRRIYYTAQMDPLRITQKSPSFPPSPSEASILAAFNHTANNFVEALSIAISYVPTCTSGFDLVEQLFRRSTLSATQSASITSTQHPNGRLFSSPNGTASSTKPAVSTIDVFGFNHPNSTPEWTPFQLSKWHRFFHEASCFNHQRFGEMFSFNHLNSTPEWIALPTPSSSRFAGILDEFATASFTT
ncbi:hypothetical protein BKA70DRAFT_1441132 [Coprinopsis sp. MPI-PUGE-AT-0042]|nr:hypothetical protein BKA70DRAFT_1441132 [Coprinopsis sp. MPI-PUGE-AT-0042]